MRLLLDSGAVIRAGKGSRGLPQRVQRAIEVRRNAIFVSVATIYELEYKARLGKLKLNDRWRDDVSAFGASWLDIQAHHASRAAALPLSIRDPFDRIIVAQALEESLTLVTSDARLDGCGAAILW